jgi:hypothetical protein
MPPLHLAHVAGDLAATVHLLGFGHSHLTGIQFAHAAMLDAGEPAPCTTFLQLRDDEFSFHDYSAGRAARIAGLVTTRVRAYIDDISPAAPLIFTHFSGNEYHQFCLVKNPRPFDFTLPDKPGLPLEAGYEIVPFRFIEQHMRNALATPQAEFTAILKQLQLPVIALCPPPPMPDNEYLANDQNPFITQIRAHGIGAPMLRLKFWLLQTRLMHDFYSENGVTFLPPPPHTLDANGFMRKEGWNPDAVHGSVWYGRQLLDMLTARALTARDHAA